MQHSFWGYLLSDIEQKSLIKEFYPKTPDSKTCTVVV